MLLHVGTNDMVQDKDVANAPARLTTLIDRLFAAIPGVTIIASTLLPKVCHPNIWIILIYPFSCFNESCILRRLLMFCLVSTTLCL